MGVWGTYDYILQDKKSGTTKGKYVGVGGGYTSNPDRARVFTGNHLKDIQTVNHRQWREDFKPIEVR